MELRYKRYVMVLVIFCGVIFSVKSADARRDSHPWIIRGDFVWIGGVANEWDPIDNLYGLSADILHAVSPNFRIGAELNYATGDEDLLGINVDATWIQLLALGEYNFNADLRSNAIPYVGLGIGAVNAEMEVLFISDDDTSLGLKPYLGLDYFFSESTGINLQIGYLWSESTLFGIDGDTTGFEGKIGISFRF